VSRAPVKRCAGLEKSVLVRVNAHNHKQRFILWLKARACLKRQRKVRDLPRAGNRCRNWRPVTARSSWGPRRTDSDRYSARTQQMVGVRQHGEKKAQSNSYSASLAFAWWEWLQTQVYFIYTPNPFRWVNLITSEHLSNEAALLNQWVSVYCEAQTLIRLWYCNQMHIRS